jgi:hypothetical protein
VHRHPTCDRPLRGANRQLGRCLSDLRKRPHHQRTSLGRTLTVTHRLMGLQAGGRRQADRHHRRRQHSLLSRRLMCRRRLARRRLTLRIIAAQPRTTGASTQDAAKAMVRVIVTRAALHPCD